MNKGEIRNRCRREMKDTRKPYLFSDEQLDDWINEAEVEAARRAFLLVDSTSDAATLDIAAGDVGADLHPSVIYVRRARLVSIQKQLVPVVCRTMDETSPAWESATASTPIAFVPDWQTGYLRLWPPNKIDDTVAMTVVRKPLKPMTKDSDVPEIREHYHAMLLDWPKFRAYSTPDSDFFDQKKADRHEAAFVRNFGQSAPIDEHWAQEQYFDVGAN